MESIQAIFYTFCKYLPESANKKIKTLFFFEIIAYADLKRYFYSAET